MDVRVALVTGASSGIGRGLALALAARGALVVLCARRAEALARVADEVRAAGGRARVEPMDVGDAEPTVARIRALDAELGGLDLVVANAGVGADPRAAAPYAWEALGEACRVNFTGAAATLTAALPAMVARGRGHLVGISSLASFGALPASAAYCAPKAGLGMLLECLRTDLAGTGVRVTTVNVGFVRTPMTEGATHPMPGLMDCDAAVARIMRALPSAPAVIEFPVPLALAARGAAALPRWVRGPLLRALARVR